jgi:hypothetical protein
VTLAVDERRRTRAGFRAGGLAVTLAGAVLVLLALTTLDWLSVRGDSTFAQISARLHVMGPYASGLAIAYFNWLGWVAFGVVLAVAVLAALPTAHPAVLRVAGLLLGVAAAALTIWSVKLSATSVPSLGDTLSSQRAGFYAAVVGFVLMGVGAALGPSRRGGPSRRAGSSG